MAKLRIKNFESIDGFIEFKKYTIFIGDLESVGFDHNRKKQCIRRGRSN